MSILEEEVWNLSKGAIFCSVYVIFQDDVKTRNDK